MRDDLDAAVQNLAVAAGVVGMVMAVQQVLDRLRRDALHLLEHLRDILGKLVVHQDDAFRRDAHGHVSRLVQQPVISRTGPATTRRARIERPPDDVQGLLDLFDAHRLGRGPLLASHREPGQHPRDQNGQRHTHGDLLPHGAVIE